MIHVSNKSITILALLGTSLLNFVILIILDGLNTRTDSLSNRPPINRQDASPMAHLEDNEPFLERDKNYSEWVDVQVSLKLINRPVENQEAFENPWILASKNQSITRATFWRRQGARLVIWSMDLKVAPIFALKHLLQRQGVHVIDESQSPNCQLTDTCSKTLPKFSARSVNSLSASTRKAILKHIYETSVLETVDAFLCINPVSLCELYLPLNKSIILVIDGRYELGRSNVRLWEKWNENIKLISSNKKNIVVATNQYDIEYVRNFVGIEPLILPYQCDYVDNSYAPGQDYLLLPSKRKGFTYKFLDDYRAAIAHMSSQTPATLVLKDEKEAKTRSQQASRYRGIVVIPHQVSYLAFTEYYRMNIPLMLPSMELLVRWHHRYHILQDRSLSESRSPDRRRSNIHVKSSLPDPNDDTQDWAAGFWVQFADFYMMPHLQYFTSAEDLAHQLSYLSVEQLLAISSKMDLHNNKEKRKIEQTWSDILSRIK